MAAKLFGFYTLQQRMIGERGDELRARGPGHLGFQEDGLEDERVDGGVWMGFLLEPQAVAIPGFSESTSDVVVRGC